MADGQARERELALLFRTLSILADETCQGRCLVSDCSDRNVRTLLLGLPFGRRESRNR